MARKIYLKKVEAEYFETCVGCYFYENDKDCTKFEGQCKFVVFKLINIEEVE